MAEIRSAAKHLRLEYRAGDFSLSPLLRGEGRGEGLLQQVLTRGYAPSPEAFGFDLSPQAGRGDLARLPIQLKVIML
jgi:hypothetical protein